MEGYILISAVLSGAVLGAAVVWLTMRKQADAVAVRLRGEAEFQVAALEEQLVSRQEELREQRSITDSLGRRVDEQLAALSQKAVEIARLEEKCSKIQGLEDQLRLNNSKLDQLADEKGEFAQENARLKEQLKSEQAKLIENIAVLNEAKETLKVEFQNVASQIFDDKSKRFADQSRANLDTILGPFRDQIRAFEQKVTDTYEKEGRERFSLMKEVQRLQDLNQQISEDAENLTRALKGDCKTQGTWGEMILERILEESGLRKGIEYDAQGGFRDAEGKLLKPDVIVHLPEERDIVVDSKVTLVAYERYVQAVEDDDRERAVKAHLQSINSHLKDLGSKQYDDLPGLRSLDFVLMFIPIESAFMLAIERDSEIFRKAFEQNIVIVSPSTLLVTLRTIQSIWRYEYQNRNALEIAQRAGDLYDKFVGFIEDLERIGESLERSKKIYDGAHNKLVSGRGNLINRAHGLLELGVKSKKQLPRELTEEARLELPEERGCSQASPAHVEGSGPA
ncbi:MAG: DNA recombination protein RmuC [Desulfuromonadales bacterium]|nr:DNA recombination protein RmuC [Desulfuromonadales bacterium]